MNRIGVVLLLMLSGIVYAKGDYPEIRSSDIQNLDVKVIDDSYQSEPMFEFMAHTLPVGYSIDWGKAEHHCSIPSHIIESLSDGQPDPLCWEVNVMDGTMKVGMIVFRMGNVKVGLTPKNVSIEYGFVGLRKQSYPLDELSDVLLLPPKANVR